MKFEVKNRVAIFQNDAILGLSDDQARQRRHQLEALGKGTYRVIGPNVKFRFREIVDIVDGPAAPTAMKDEALGLGIKFGLGVGAKTLATRISETRQAATIYNAAAAKTTAERKASRKAARANAAKARK